MSASLKDLYHALRTLLKSPGLTTMAALSLAVGIGLNTTIFGVMDATFLKPIPFKDPDAIVRFENRSFSYRDYLDFRYHCRSLMGLTAVSHQGALIRGADSFERIGLEVVSRNYFSVVGIQPFLGSVFSENILEGQPVVLISYGLWQRRLGADPRVVGQTIQLNDRPFMVLGVIPKGFFGIRRFPRTDVWSPVDAWDRVSDDTPVYSLLGRLARAGSSKLVQAEADVVLERLSSPYTQNRRNERLVVWSETESTMDHGGKLALLIMPCVGLVLFVACANVASLLLSWNETRRRELAIRLALGAGRLRLMRQLLTEDLFLCTLGAALGLLLTGWINSLLPMLIPSLLQAAAPELRLDSRVLTLSLGLIGLSILIFGFIPAFRAAKGDLAPLLNGATAYRAGRWKYFAGRNLLVTSQLSVALAFMITAGLFVRSFHSGLQMDMGFQKKSMLLVTLIPELYGFDQMHSESYLSRLKSRLLELPDVLHVSLASRAPIGLMGDGAVEEVFLEGDDLSADQSGRRVNFNVVDTDYFATTGIRILRGRTFDEQDTKHGPRVVMISQAMARRFWPDGEPIGRIIKVGRRQLEPRRIIGVVNDVGPQGGASGPQPFVYLPYRQKTTSVVTLLIETRGSATAIGSLVWREIGALDKRVVPVNVETLADSIRLALLPQWIGLWFVGTLSLLAVVLTTTGLYGAIAYSVSRRSREFGVRIALGATRGDILRSVLRQGLTQGLLGVMIGGPIGILGGVAIRRLLYGVSPLDSVAVGCAISLLLSVTLLASYFPARQAMQTNPMVVLRNE